GAGQPARRRAPPVHARGRAVKLPLAAWLAIALALSLAGNAVQLYLAGGQKPKCEASKANAVVAANDQLHKDEAKRDRALDSATRATQEQTRTAVVQVEKETHERA